MKKLLVLVLALAVIACGSQPAVIQALATQVTPAPTNTPAPTIVPTDTTVPTYTYTPGPTSTPAPTDTPVPTLTPLPTETPVPTQAPIILKGKGNQVVNVNKPDGPMLLHAKYTGGSNFIVHNYDADGNQIDYLINTIGAYDGTVPLDFDTSKATTTRFEVHASGPWELSVLPLSQIRTENIPGTFTGKGDDVVLLTGGTPDTLTADAKGNSNFVIWSYGSSSNDLVVNEIAPYSGTSILSSDTQVLVIEAEGPWTIQIATR